MFKKHRQGGELPKNDQFDIYAITSNFFNKFQRNFAKKLIITQQIRPQKVTLLLRYQFSCFIKDFNYSKARVLFFVNI